MADKKSEKILIINIHSSKNMGDAALLQVAINQIKENFLNCRITLAMDDPESHEGDEEVVHSVISWVYQHNKDGKSKWNYSRLVGLLPTTLIPLISYKLLNKRIMLFSPVGLRKLIKAYLDADLVISKPGGYIYSTGRGVSFLLIMYTLLIAHLAGKPIYLFPQSIGPLHNKWEAPVLRWIIDHARVVMIREPISFEFVKKIGIHNPQCYLVPDVAFAMPSAGHAAGISWLSDHGIFQNEDYPLLGITVFDWGAHDSRFTGQHIYEKSITAMIKFFVQTYNGQVVLFPQAWGPVSGEDDRITAHRIVNNIHNLSDKVVVVQEPIPGELLKSLYGCMDIFIGTRMHSNIFAACEGVPLLAIGYQHKTMGIMSMLGLDQWVIDIHQINEESLIEKISKLLLERREWHLKIQASVPKLVEGACQAGKLVADDYYKRSNYLFINEQIR